MIACGSIFLLSHYQWSLMSCLNASVTVFYDFYRQNSIFFWFFPHYANSLCHSWYIALGRFPDWNNEYPVPPSLWYLLGDPGWECKQLRYRQNCTNYQKNVMIWRVVGKIVNSFFAKMSLFCCFFRINCVSNRPLEYMLRCILPYYV